MEQNIQMIIEELPASAHEETKQPSPRELEEEQFAEWMRKQNARVGTIKDLGDKGFVKYTEVRDMGGSREAKGTCVEENSAKILELWDKVIKKGRNPNQVRIRTALLDARLAGIDDVITHTFIIHDPDFNPDDPKHLSPNAKMIDVSNGVIKRLDYIAWERKQFLLACGDVNYTDLMKYYDNFSGGWSGVERDIELDRTELNALRCRCCEIMRKLKYYYKKEFVAEHADIIHILQQCYISIINKEKPEDRLIPYMEEIIDKNPHRFAHLCIVKIPHIMFNVNWDIAQKHYEEVEWKCDCCGYTATTKELEECNDE